MLPPASSPDGTRPASDASGAQAYRDPMSEHAAERIAAAPANHRTAMIIGGTGQIGIATTRRLAADGWSVLIVHRGEHRGDPSLAELDVTTMRIDRENTEQLLEHARGHDLVLDTVAYSPAHGDQLAQLAGEVGSLVVISSAAVYVDAEGRTMDRNGGTGEFPVFPDPITEEQPTVTTDGDGYGEQKAALERRLLAVADLPVSILRPAAIHGPFSEALREWYFLKRALDHRERVVLAYDGASRFSTSATWNIAELVALCAERPGRRALNAADDEGLTVAEIGRAVFAERGLDPDVLTFAGPPRDGVGANPWAVPSPLVLDMARAREEVGYRAATTYEKAVRHDIRWMLDALETGARDERSWQELFPTLALRYGANTWFPYHEEDAWAAANAPEGRVRR